MDRLGGLVVIAPASRAGDPGSNTGPGENFFSLKLLMSGSLIFITKLVPEFGILVSIHCWLEEPGNENWIRPTMLHYFHMGKCSHGVLARNVEDRTQVWIQAEFVFSVI